MEAGIEFNWGLGKHEISAGQDGRMGLGVYSGGARRASFLLLDCCASGALLIPESMFACFSMLGWMDGLKG